MKKTIVIGNSILVFVATMALTVAFATVAELEREYILQRQREGIAIAKAQGKFKGRKEVKADDFAAQYRRYLNRELNKAQLAKTLGISRPTLDKLIRQHTTA